MVKSTKVLLLTLILFVVVSIFLSSSKTQNYQEVSQPQPKIQGVAIDQSASESPQNLKDQVLVSRVVDGDTIEISTGQKVRYIGIDTPETVHP